MVILSGSGTASAPQPVDGVTCINSNVLLIRTGLGGGRGKKIGPL